MTGSCLFKFCLFWSNTMFITCSSLWNVLKQIPVKYHHFSFCLSQLIIKAPFPLLLRWIVIFYYSITCSHCYHSFMQFLIIQHFQFSIFIVSKSMEHVYVPNYTINPKYALFYLSIHNDGKHQLCTSNTSKSYSFGNQYPHYLWCFTQHSIWTKMEQSIVDVSIS